MNSIGQNFRVSVFGESHGASVGVVIDGIPEGLPLVIEDFMPDIKRRKSGSKGTTPRIESDLPNIISGHFNDHTTGGPMTIVFSNDNVRSKDYSNLLDHPRPGHADFVSKVKYKGFADYNGGGHFSGRLTLALVAAGVVAKKIVSPIKIEANILSLKGRTDFEAVLEEAMDKKDSVGGIVECRAQNMPIGLGEPFFSALEATIARLVYSIPAIKGIEFGSGFGSTKLWGSENNDNIMDQDGRTETNHCGGINGGISNGNDLVFRIAVKPTSSVGVSQNTFHFGEQKVKPLLIEGRHDTCIALRVPPVLEAVTAIALADLSLVGDINF